MYIVVKEAPYSVKESGYAGFVLTIDIYVKNREEPKKISFSYDLDLQQTGPTIQRKQSEKFIFTNPSEELRRKLLKGGGVLLANTTSNLDEKSKDETKVKMSAMTMNDTAKKHKLRPEDPFTNLFGTPITKTSTKVSPDPKSKTSPNRGKPQQSGSQGGKVSGEKGVTAKEKPEKESKSSKHSKHSSPHRVDKIGDAKDSRKAEEKYERREEKKKDRNHSKDRDKSKEKPVKKPASPKRSPKRMSPSRGSIATKAEEKLQVPLGGGNEKGGSSKKMKKEKKEKSHEKDRERKEHKKDSTGTEKATAKGANVEKSEMVKAKDVNQGPKEQSAREKVLVV